ncbi:histidine phosphatase family protein [Rapidithrix thailandica]|uniref:Histidine phosphatase family protein n=1 Tax=Rapidithrix thailandica TaxID=413964 RepID=A0AAW9SJC8_9BACT
MKRICLVTHAEASHSIEGKVGGWYDSTLTSNGEQQASSLLQKITGYGFQLDQLNVYSSDLQRAVQTAKVLLKDSGVKPNLDKRLREMSFGSHEGMNQQKHNRIMTPVNSQGERMDHRICEGAESRRDVAIRITEFVNEIMTEAGDVLVVTHGFAATFFIAAFQKVGIESMGYINYALQPGSISILQEDDLFKNRSLTLLNG